MRILVVHNRYQLAGGEDSVCDAEIELLRDGGHIVEALIFDNHSIRSSAHTVKTAFLTPYNPLSKREIEKALDVHRPDVVHVHNWFPLVSPSIFDACVKYRIPVVWTLHNFRLTCVNGLLFRDGHICEKCLGRRVPLPGIVHRCYRDSLIGSAIVATTDILHAWLGTWSHKVDRFIALNDFARDKFVEAGVPPSRLVVKPNFLPDPGSPSAISRSGALFIGRLSPEKGVDVLLRAWKDISFPLTIIGTGPEEEKLRAIAGQNVHFIGHLARDAVAQRLRNAAMLIVPSLWYENFPMVIVEAFAHGVPVLVSSGGALARIVNDQKEGWHFKMGDAADLRRVLYSLTAGMLAHASQQARARYERDLAPAANLRQLEAIYSSVLSGSRV